MVVFPNAKINLGLHVLSKRADGYHEIISGIYPLPVHDVLEIVPSERFSFEVTGLEIAGDPADNICVKAYQAIGQYVKIPPVKMILYKNIPMGAGLGGGSSDGTFTLKLLDRMFKLGLGNQKLEGLALSLGSDCPFFVENKPKIVQGRGERLEKLDLDLKGWWFVLVYNGTHLSTSSAYQNISTGAPKADINQLLPGGPGKWKDLLQNDFEPFAFTQDASIQVIKQQLYELGATYASMSGSGSAVYGLFATQPEIGSVFSGYTVFSGLIPGVTEYVR